MEFDQFAGRYEEILDRSVSVSGEDSAYFADYKAQYVQRLLTPSFAGKVLDFGCGVGVFASALKKLLPNVKIEGFDVSQESIEKVDPALSQMGLFTSHSDALAHNYDLIVIANVMHHVPREQRPSIFSDVASRLTPGGKLAIFEHNPANPVTRWVVERCPFDDDAVLLTPTEIGKYFAQSGLRQLRRDYIVFMPRALAWLRPLEPSLQWLPMGAQYAMVATKNA